MTLNSLTYDLQESRCISAGDISRSKDISFKSYRPDRQRDTQTTDQLLHLDAIVGKYLRLACMVHIIGQITKLAAADRHRYVNRPTQRPAVVVRIITRCIHNGLILFRSASICTCMPIAYTHTTRENTIESIRLWFCNMTLRSI